MNKLTHIDIDGNAKMVDVSIKRETARTASASCLVKMSARCFKAVVENNIKKGDVLTVAKIAGIQAAKKTAELIPLCHIIPIDNIEIDFKLLESENTIIITSHAVTFAKTGIEMEAITSVTIAAVTIYDMCKAIDKSITITDIKLLKKSGGKSGEYISE